MSWRDLAEGFKMARRSVGNGKLLKDYVTSIIEGTKPQA